MDKPRHPQVIRPWKPVRRIPDRVPKTNPRKPLPPKKAREVRGRVSGDTMRHGNARAQTCFLPVSLKIHRSTPLSLAARSGLPALGQPGCGPRS
jgi:hypothetical protein